jgi:hypothetical protein
MINKIKSILASVWSDICDTYQRIKIYLLGILAIIAVFEWRKLKALWLVNSGAQELKSDNKQDIVLKANENQANQQADQLVQDANNLNNNQPSVREDWYKKKDGSNE